MTIFDVGIVFCFFIAVGFFCCWRTANKQSKRDNNYWNGGFCKSCEDVGYWKFISVIYGNFYVYECSECGDEIIITKRLDEDESN